jgi:hypothetical protein
MYNTNKSRKEYEIMYAYIAWDLFTNLETFSTIIDFQEKCYGKYTPKYVYRFVPPVNLRSESANII